MITYSLEFLYHFRCSNCGNWWSIADWKNKISAISCPHCSNTEKATKAEWTPETHGEEVAKGFLENM